ncbi:MAG: hypothetical protein RL681_415 [Candidatus Parcubacteria bacterium]
MKLDNGVELHAPDPDDRRTWRVAIPSGKATLVFKFKSGGDGLELDLARTSFEASEMSRTTTAEAMSEAGRWFNELGRRNADTHAADGDEE